MSDEAKDFGKEVGLVHQAIVTGRRFGANRAFWATLAHHPTVFRQVAAIVKKAQWISTDEKKAVAAWLQRIEQSDYHLYDEPECYWALRDQSNHRTWLCELMSSFDSLYKRAEFGEEARSACVCVEKVFHMTYLHSALYWSCNYDECSWNPPNHPSGGMGLTLEGLLNDAPEILRGQYLTLGTLQADSHVAVQAAIREELMKLDYNVGDGAIFEQKVAFFEAHGAQVVSASRKALIAAIDELKLLIR